MDEPSYFQSALSSFVTDAACGGAIRHLVDIGYTLDQIVDRLDYPAPRAKVQRIMMDYLYESRVLLREEPSAKLFAAKVTFVQEQDAFGRRSMRKIMIDSDSQTQEILWKESIYEPRRDGKLTELLHRKCGQNGEIFNYVSCPFGKLENDRYSQIGRSGQSESGGAFVAEKIWSCLNNRQRDYIQGIRWDQPVLYHRLNQRMLEIIGKLYEAGVYSGAAFFAASREKITIPTKVPSHAASQDSRQ